MYPQLWRRQDFHTMRLGKHPQIEIGSVEVKNFIIQLLQSTLVQKKILE